MEIKPAVASAFALALSFLIFGCVSQPLSLADMLVQSPGDVFSATYALSSGIGGAPNATALLVADGNNDSAWFFEVSGNNVSDYDLGGKYYSCTKSQDGTACFASTKKFGLGKAEAEISYFESNPSKAVYIGARKITGIDAYCYFMNTTDATAGNVNVTGCYSGNGIPLYHAVYLGSGAGEVAYIREAKSVSLSPDLSVLAAPNKYSMVNMPGLGGDIEGGIGLDCVQTCNLLGAKPDISFCLNLCTSP